MTVYRAVRMAGQIAALLDPTDAAASPGSTRYDEILARVALGLDSIVEMPPVVKKIDHQTFTGELQTTTNAPTFIFNKPLDPATGYLAEVVVVAVADAAPFDRATWKAGIQAVRITGGAILDGQGFIPPWPIKSAGATAWNIQGSVSGNNFRVAVIGENGRAINWQLVLSFVRFNDDGLVD